MGYVGNNGTLDTDYAGSIANRTATVGTGAFRNGANAASAYADFDQSIAPINSYFQGSSGGGYTVQAGDTLAGIAQRVYGDASLWYKIAEANGLSGQSALIEGQSLILPAGAIKSAHNASTFTPYDPNEAIGDTAPTTFQPKPKKAKCGVFGQIILVIIAAVVTYFTAGAASAYFGPIVSGAIGGAAGSIASQAVGVATGIQDKFSWNAVALAAIGGAVGGSGIGDKLAKSIGVVGGAGQAAVAGAVNNAVTQGIGVATGLQDKFSWAGVAAAGVGSAAFQFASARLPGAAHINAAGQKIGASWSNRFGASTASMIADAGARSLIEGSDFGDNIMAALPNLIGQTIGEAIAGGIAETMRERDWEAQFAGMMPEGSNPGDLNWDAESSNPYRDLYYDENGNFHDPGTGQSTSTWSEFERYNGQIVEGPLPELDVSVTMDPIVITATAPVRNGGSGIDAQAREIARASLDAMRESRRQHQAQQRGLEQQRWSQVHQAASAQVRRELGGAAWQFARDWAPGISDVSGAVDFVNRPTWLGGAAVVVGVVPVAGDALAKGLRHLDNIPTGGAASAANAARLRAQLVGQEIAGGHAFDKHVLGVGNPAGSEFTGLGIRTRAQFAEHIENVVANPTSVRELSGGRTAFWDDRTGTVVIRNPRAADGGTAFRPIDGRTYFDVVLN